MALKNKIHFDIDTLETLSGTQGQAIATLQGQATTASGHIDAKNNPHQVTAAQVGAVTAGELSNAIDAVVEALDWKEMVATFADLAIEYPEPDQGWTASVAADNLVYRYDGTNWVSILGAAIPLATANNNGLMSQQDFTKLGTIESGAQPDQNAGEVPYDNQTSGLVSTNVKGALDELQIKKLDVTALSTTLALYPTDTPSDVLAPALKLVTSVTDPDYNVSAVNINTPAILGQNQPVGRIVSEPGVIIGNPGVITVSTIGQIRKISGNANQKAAFYYTISRYDGATQTVVTPPITTSDVTQAVESTSFEEFFASALLNNGIFGAQDRIVIDYFANQVQNDGAVYQFQFGGDNPVRTLFPVPVEVIPAPDASKIILDTVGFDGILSGSDNTVQQALDTIDDHNHDLLYLSLDAIATQAEAEEGTNNTKYMTPLRTTQALEQQLTSEGFITSGEAETISSSLFGVGFDFNSGSEQYDLSYADNTEAIAGESTTKVITPATLGAAITDAQLGGGGVGGFADGVIETNNDIETPFWVGTQAEYDAIITKDINTVYLIEEEV